MRENSTEQRAIITAQVMISASCLSGLISSSVTSRVSSTYGASNAPNAPRKGRYRVRKLIEKYGRKANMMKLKEQLNGDCPKRDAHSMHERCDLGLP